MSVSFVGSEESDGVALSVDGNTWYRLVSLTGKNSTETYSTKTFDLSAEAAANGLTLGSDVQIKFQQFGEFEIDFDGMAFDNISVTEIARGTPGNDRLRGTAGDDEIDGFAGNDTIKGFAGDDRLVGAAGDDSLIGGNGDDTLAGGNGKDTLRGSRGSDRLNGDSGDDILIGRGGDDDLNGGEGTDTIIETANTNFTLTDTTLTGNGHDTISNVEAVILTGGGGNNAIDAKQVTQMQVTLKGGGGSDNLI